MREESFVVYMVIMSTLTALACLVLLYQGSNGFQCQNCCVTSQQMLPMTIKDANGQAIACTSNLDDCKDTTEKSLCGSVATHCYIREGMLQNGYYWHMRICYKMHSQGDNGQGLPKGLRCDGTDETMLDGTNPESRLSKALAPATKCDLLTATAPTTTSTTMDPTTTAPSSASAVLSAVLCFYSTTMTITILFLI